LSVEIVYRAEALFADIGHFSRGSIQLGMFAVVVRLSHFPSLAGPELNLIEFGKSKASIGMKV